MVGRLQALVYKLLCNGIPQVNLMQLLRGSLEVTTLWWFEIFALRSG